MKLFEAKLLPCAHCGSTHVRVVRNILGDEDAYDVTWRVECTSCGMQTFEFPEDVNDSAPSCEAVVHAMNDAIECAVRTWNTRAGDAKDTASDDSEDDVKDVTPDWLGFREAMKDLDDLCNMVHEWSKNYGKR